MADNASVVNRLATHTLRIVWPIEDQAVYVLSPAVARRCAKAEVRQIADELQATIVGATTFEEKDGKLVCTAPAVLRLSARRNGS